MKNTKIMITMMLIIVMAFGMFTGCTKKAEVPVEPEQKPVEVPKELEVTVSAEETFTAIQNQPVELAKLIKSVELDEGLTFEAVMFNVGEVETTLDNTVELGKASELTEGKFNGAEGDTTLLDTESVKTLSTVFTDITTEPLNFTVTFMATKADAETVSETAVAEGAEVVEDAVEAVEPTEAVEEVASEPTKPVITDNMVVGVATVKVTVVPEVIAEVSELTDNLQVSQDLESYNFDTRAKNFETTISPESNLKTIRVKESNVEFKKPGVYRVIYEVELKEPIVISEQETIVVIEIPTIVIIIDEKDAEIGTPVITEDVVPGIVVEPVPTPDGEAPVVAPPVNDNSKPAPSTPAPNNNSKPNNNSNNNSNNSSSSTPAKPADPNAGKTWVEGQNVSRQVERTRQVDNWVDEGYYENVTSTVSVWVSSDGKRFYSDEALADYMYKQFMAGIDLTSRVEQETKVTGQKWVSKMVNRPITETYYETITEWVPGYWK